MRKWKEDKYFHKYLQVEHADCDMLFSLLFTTLLTPYFYKKLYLDKYRDKYTDILVAGKAV